MQYSGHVNVREKDVTSIALQRAAASWQEKLTVALVDHLKKLAGEWVWHVGLSNLRKKHCDM